MTQTQLLKMCRLSVPEIDSIDVIEDDDLLLFLNLGCKEFIKVTDALPTSITFNLIEDLTTYPLSTYVTSFGKIRKEGLWLYNSENTKWDQLDSTTVSYLNKHYASWMNTRSQLPQRFSIDGDDLTLHPKASSTYAGDNYLKLFFFKRSLDMSDGSHYPFSGSTTEYPHLADYEDVPVEYVRYKVKQMLKKNADAEEAKTTFYLKSADAKQKLQYRPDLIPEVRAHGAGNLLFHKEAFKR